MKAGLLMGLESPSNRAERLARLVQIWDRVPPLEETIARIDAVTTGDVRELCRGDGGHGARGAGALRPGRCRTDPGAAAGEARRLMLLVRKRKLKIETERLTLRPPVHSDFRAWAALRRESATFLTPWEPSWAADHLTRKSFTNRVYWAQRSVASGSAVPLFLIRRDGRGADRGDHAGQHPPRSGAGGHAGLLDRRAASARQGYMREAIDAVVHYAFTRLDLSRIEAACLPENAASRGLLESCGFKYEGVAQSYLQINGRWRNHVLYAALRGDRRGKTRAVSA